MGCRASAEEGSGTALEAGMRCEYDVPCREGFSAAPSSGGRQDEADNAVEDGNDEDDEATPPRVGCD